MEDEEEEEDESEDLEVLPRPPAPHPLLPPPCLWRGARERERERETCCLRERARDLLPASVCACAFRMKAHYSECRCDMRARVARAVLLAHALLVWHMPAHAVLVDACHSRCKQDKCCITSPLLYLRKILLLSY